MNERIKQLQFQAAATISPLKEGKEWQQEFVEKFTELVVRECAKFTDRAEELYKHFGVKND